jgi:ABC-2 type transport system permease protein
MNWLRVLLVGGLTSYRALFNWISPWIFFPHMIGFPVFETLFFAYLGRFAGVQSDTFFLIGNAFIAIAVTGMFGMSAAISGERRQQTLSALLASPASRVALFLGRALPSIVTGVVVAVASATICALILDVSIDASQLPALLVVALVASFSCTSLGLWLGAFGLRGRNMTVFADAIAGLMLIVTGANVPLDSLPQWVQEISRFVPLTHAIEAAREIAAGATLDDVAGLVQAELEIGLVFLLVGLALLRLFEYEGRRSATLEVF